MLADGKSGLVKAGTVLLMYVVHTMYCIVQKKSINAQIAHDSLMVFNQDAILTNLRWTE